MTDHNSPILPGDREFLAKLESIRDHIADAELIVGMHQDGHAIFWGEDLLRAIAASRKKRDVKTVKIRYDSRLPSEQLEIFCAFVTAVKGACNYKASDPHDGQNRMVPPEKE